ncbi:MAG: transporter [Lactobacillales bacterium]|nr:transporter [Lactobacillales bacterium]
MFKRSIIFILSVFFWGQNAPAGEVGHYSAGAWGPWDHMSPARGTGQVAAGMAYYKTDKLKNSSGSERRINANLDLPQAMALVKYSPKMDILNANYSFGIVPTYGRTNINAYLSGTRFESKGEQTGWSDLYVIPANLTWDVNKYAMVSAQYALWAPTGSYKKDRVLNNGLGYWSHDFRLTGSFFPEGNPATLLSVSGLYEFNTKKDGKDIHPGDRFVMELGASHVFNKYVIAGVLATANWEITKTTGSQATDDKKDRVFSAGPEAMIYIVPDKLSVTLRYLAEFGVKDRTQGQFFFAFVGYQF